MRTRVGIATDHGGFGLKEELIAKLRAAGHEVTDFGAHALNDGDDYPDFVAPFADAAVAGKVERGVAICGSGVGASICANKVKGVRAVLVHDHFSAKQGVEHDHIFCAWAEGPWGRKWLGIRSGPSLFGGSVQPGRTAFAPLGQGSGPWKTCLRRAMESEQSEQLSIDTATEGVAEKVWVRT